MTAQRRDAAIVGIHEYPLRNVGGQSNPLRIKAECAARALEDAGLNWTDVDGIYDAGEGDGRAGINTVSEYFGIKPNVIDTTYVGGSSYELHAAHARRDIREGRCKVALLTYGATSRSNSRAIGVGFQQGGLLPTNNMESFCGETLVANYAMVAHRHMHEFGTTSEQLAEISVAARFHATRNPEAVKALEDLGISNVGELTVEDVVNSRMVADPLRVLECCLISDGGGAVVIASAEVARDCRKPPVWILGAGEATGYPESGADLTVSAAGQSGPLAFAEAGVAPSEIDIAMIYDSFTITTLTILEDLGFCAKGEGGAWVEGGRLRFDRPSDGPALNTDGGGLSSNHPGMRGIFLLIESVRQLRGDSTSQVPGASLAVAHGNGGRLGSRHFGGTVIMGRD